MDRAIVLFERYSRRLYGERRGSLAIEPKLTGPAFSVETLLTERDLGPGFLIHDSHLFDGVDERQIASAMVLASELTEELGFQYITTMNGDAVPEFDSSFDFDALVNGVRLTDETEDGGLFGFRFS